MLWSAGSVCAAERCCSRLFATTAALFWCSACYPRSSTSARALWAPWCMESMLLRAPAAVRARKAHLPVCEQPLTW